MISGSSSQEYRTSSEPTIVKSEYFRRAQNVAIGENANLSTVQGNQNNYYNAEVRKQRFIVGTEEEEAEYAEFTEVKRGDVVAFRTVHHDDGWVYDGEHRKYVNFERMLVAGEVRAGGVASKCIAVSYSGEGAEEQWKEDFRRRPENAQLVAINLSKIAMLVLTGDLVPAAHLAGWVGAIGRMYLDALSYQLDYHEDADDSLWMDTSRGVFCRGPEGPVWNVGVGFQLDDLPLDAELVKEDVLIRYLATTSVDRGVVKWLSQTYDYQVSRVRVNRPTVISTLNDTILAVESGDWRVHEDTCLGEKTELLYGTRFTLKENGCPLELGLDWEEAWCDWYAQAPSVFHAYGVSLEGDLKAYKLVLPEKLTGTLSQSKAKRQRRQKSSPIYLFLSMSTFWSFDQDGQTPIPADLCRRLGLPPWLSPETWEYTWRTSTYKALRDYQIARKFDPTTTNFAQHHGYRIYDVVKNPGLSGHFKEMDDSDPTESATAPQPREVHTESVHQTETELEDMSLGLPFGDPQREIDSHPDLKAQKYFGGFFFAVHRSVLVPSIGFVLPKRIWMLATITVLHVSTSLYLAVELLANLRSGLQVRSWVAAIAH